MKRTGIRQSTGKSQAKKKKPSVPSLANLPRAYEQKRQRSEKSKQKTLPAIDQRAAIEKEISEEITPSKQDIKQFFTAGGASVVEARRDIFRKLIILKELACGEYAHEKRLRNPQHYATEALVTAGRLVNYILVGLAKQNSALAADSIWDSAFALVSTIKELALTNPKLLRPTARKSLRLPSFRANVKKFTDDFQIVSEALQLGAELGVKTGDAARYSLDAPVTRYVENLLNEAIAKRAFLIQMEPAWKEGSSKRHGTKEKFLSNLPGVQLAHLVLLELPPYGKKTGVLWWEKYFKPYLHQSGILESLKGTKIYDEIVRAAKVKTDYHLLDDLKKACRARIVDSFVPHTAG